MTLSLLVMVPTRWRRENVERQVKSFTENTSNADIIYIIDDDDQDTYEDIDWGIASHTVFYTGGERVGTTKKVNHVSASRLEDYDAFMYIGDDHLFSTPKWDEILLGKIEEMGGTGMAYGDDKRRIDIPEMIAISADIIKALGGTAGRVHPLLPEPDVRAPALPGAQ
jgi:hypothetical protein